MEKILQEFYNRYTLSIACDYFGTINNIQIQESMVQLAKSIQDLLLDKKVVDLNIYENNLYSLIHNDPIPLDQEAPKFNVFSSNQVVKELYTLR